MSLHVAHVWELHELENRADLRCEGKKKEIAYAGAIAEENPPTLMQLTQT
jgi:hypothetical protein